MCRHLVSRFEMSDPGALGNLVRQIFILICRINVQYYLSGDIRWSCIGLTAESAERQGGEKLKTL